MIVIGGNLRQGDFDLAVFFQQRKRFEMARGFIEARACALDVVTMSQAADEDAVLQRSRVCSGMLQPGQRS